MATYDSSRPAPVLTAAQNAGNVAGDSTGLINVHITFTNTASDARLVSAYFTINGSGPSATQNIEGDAMTSGDATVPIGGTVTEVKLRYMWGTLPGDGTDIVWGPWSNEMAIAPEAGGGTADESPPYGKGKGKGPNK